MNATAESATATRPPAAEERQPDWWHRDHPTFTALTGFFTGLVFVALVPAAFVGLLHLVVDDETTNDLFPHGAGRAGRAARAGGRRRAPGGSAPTC